jgi:hypothetical protein
MRTKYDIILLLLCFVSIKGVSQGKVYELNNGWVCKNIEQVSENGQVLSKPDYAISSWLPAIIPGTVLTTLLNNGMVPDPFYGMNNKRIPDIYYTGSNEYTYWFVKDFEETRPPVDEQVWLHLRGVNYS